MLGSPAAQAIITKGLTCGRTRACEGGSMIMAGPFSLYLPYQPRPAHEGGGGRPMMPGEIGQLYQPVPQQHYVVDRNKEAEYLRKRMPVTIQMTMGEYKVEKEYLVPEDKARIIVNIASMYNVTKERMSVKFSNMRKNITKASVKISNFRLRK